MFLNEGCMEQHGCMAVCTFSVILKYSLHAGIQILIPTSLLLSCSSTNKVSWIITFYTLCTQAYIYLSRMGTLRDIHNSQQACVTVLEDNVMYFEGGPMSHC